MTAIEPQLPLDIPLSYAPRLRRGGTGRLGPHALLARAQGRLAVLSVLFVAAFLIVALRLVDATLLQPAVSATGLNEPAAPGVILPTRADLTDRNGVVLATSLPARSLYADPARLLDPVAAARGIATALPGLPFEDVLDKLTSARRFVWIKRNLTPEEVYRINALGQPGLEFQTEQTRIYPAGSSIVHALGTTNVDGKGLSGLERALDAELAAGGPPVATSIDLRLQHIMARELGEAIRTFRAVGGAGVVMDIRTGEILAAVSLPDYLPANAGEVNDEARFNRYALGTYELGSVMKIINTAAGLESGRMTMNSFYDASEPLRYGRFVINDFHPENRELSLAEIFIHSSNIGSARMALDMGPAFQREFYCRLGLCEPVRTELMELGTPQIPANWAELSAMTIAFGHGIAVTPLHLLKATASILGGHAVTPTFRRHDPTGAAPLPPVVSERTTDQMRRLMRANVLVGSGKSADVPGYAVGGKTGTAEKTTGRRYSKDARLSSFIGAFPMHDPRYLVFAMLDEPHPNASTQGYATGGWVAAPVVGHVIAQMGPLLGIPPLAEDDPVVRNALQLEIRSRREPIATY